MLQLGEYTKDYVQYKIDYKTDRIYNLKRKLDNLGYTFHTVGRGSDCKFIITGLPIKTLKDYFFQWTGIKTYNEEQLYHFLYLIILDKSDNYVNMTPRCMEYHTYVCYNTIRVWKQILKNIGLLKERKGEISYYKTKHISKPKPDSEKYFFETLECKESNVEQHDKGINAFNDTYNECMEDIQNNPDMVQEYAKYLANSIRKRINDGWWVTKKETVYQINKEWTHYAELVKILKNFDYQPYIKWKTIDGQKRQKEYLQKQQRLNELLREKKKLVEERRKNRSQMKDINNQIEFIRKHQNTKVYTNDDEKIASLTWNYKDCLGLILNIPSKRNPFDYYNSMVDKLWTDGISIRGQIVEDDKLAVIAQHLSKKRIKVKQANRLLLLGCNNKIKVPPKEDKERWWTYLQFLALYSMTTKQYDFFISHLYEFEPRLDEMIKSLQKDWVIRIREVDGYLNIQDCCSEGKNWIVQAIQNKVDCLSVFGEHTFEEVAETYLKDYFQVEK